MFEETEQLKQKLEEMLISNDTEWVIVVIATLNAMYKQFGLERQGRKQILVRSYFEFQPPHLPSPGRSASSTLKNLYSAPPNDRFGGE